MNLGLISKLYSKLSKVQPTSVKEICGYLMGKVSIFDGETLSDHCHGNKHILLLQIFCKSLIGSKDIFKSFTGPDDNCHGNVQAWMGSIV